MSDCFDFMQALDSLFKHDIIAPVPPGDGKLKLYFKSLHQLEASFIIETV